MFNVFSVFLGFWLYITNGEAIQILNISRVGEFLTGIEGIEEVIIPSSYRMSSRRRL